ncbi:MAG: hypothetical protein ACYCZZ_00915 [Minisyncoccota bacterium]
MNEAKKIIRFFEEVIGLDGLSAEPESSSVVVTDQKDAAFTRHRGYAPHGDTDGFAHRLIFIRETK